MDRRGVNNGGDPALLRYYLRRQIKDDLPHAHGLTAMRMTFWGTPVYKTPVPIGADGYFWNQDAGKMLLSGFAGRTS